MIARDVLARLESLPPAALAGPALLAKLLEMDQDETVTHAAYVELQPQIEKAIKELEAYAKETSEVVKRCCKLSASPSLNIPAGF